MCCDIIDDLYDHIRHCDICDENPETFCPIGKAMMKQWQYELEKATGG